MARVASTACTTTTPNESTGWSTEGSRARGRYTWVTWAGEGQDVVNLVSGRDLSDAAVVAAARAARGSSIAPKGIPDGLDRLLSADIFPDGAVPAERITLVDASGTKRVKLEAFDASPLVRAMQQFWVEQSSRREHSGAGGRTAVLGPQRRPIVVARGDASVAELKSIAASMRATDAAGWQTFRDRVLDLPLTALFPMAANADGVVIDGATAGTRWGVAFSRGPGLAAVWTQIVTAELSSGGGGTGVPEGALPEVLSAGSVTTNGGSIFAGVIPAAAASARLEPVGLPPVDAVLGPTTPDGAHRYFAAWLADVGGVVPLVVYDAAGNVIAQRSQFGCNTCDA